MDITQFYDKYKDDQVILITTYRIWFTPKIFLIYLISVNDDKIIELWFRTFFKTDFNDKKIKNMICKYLDNNNKGLNSMKLFVLKSRGNSVHLKVPEKKIYKSIFDVDNLVDQLNQLTDFCMSEVNPTKFIERFTKKIDYLDNYTELYNIMISILSYEVLKHKTLKERRKTIKKILKIAEKLYESKNYHMFGAFCGTLTSLSVSRLKLTWAGIKDEKYKYLFENISPRSCYKKYREITLDSTEYYPFLPSHLREMIYSFESYPLQSLYNSKGCMKSIASTLHFFKDKDNDPYMIHNSNFLEFIYSHKIRTEDRLYKMSIKIEPANVLSDSTGSSTNKSPRKLTRTSSQLNIKQINFKQINFKQMNFKQINLTLKHITVAQLMLKHIYEWNTSYVISWMTRIDVNKDIIVLFKSFNYNGIDLMKFIKDEQNTNVKYVHWKKLKTRADAIINYFVNEYIYIKDNIYIMRYKNFPENWTVDDVTKWLCGNNMEDYSDIFFENLIDGSVLLYLDNDDLLKLGVGKEYCSPLNDLIVELNLHNSKYNKYKSDFVKY